MIAYPDTSFLCALYRLQANSPKAAAHFKRMREPLGVSSLLLFEFRQSLRYPAFLHEKDLRKGFDRTTGQAVLAKVQANIADGAVVIIPVDWTDTHQIAERLSAQHTHAGGHRGFDILHVATALHLGVREFLTFDANQKKLAKAEGLKLPL
ncbi:MAG TPA: type II toxin-antitoxin system VapC family toxin [Candidatus Methylacidiphilales bacterium]|nr:type II toxin-antitoxin system VapC family toxin [Candidatus Methylacidiphilales bacterium]